MDCVILIYVYVVIFTIISVSFLVCKFRFNTLISFKVFIKMDIEAILRKLNLEMYIDAFHAEKIHRT